jgi:hypothetical protein
MTGPQKAVAIIALAVIALGWFNWRMWRRFRTARAYRAGWSEADFDAMVADNGVSASVAAITRELVAPYYGAGVVPHPDDDFARFLAINDEEIADLVDQAWARLGIAKPAPIDPVELPPMKDVRDLAVYLGSIAADPSFNAETAPVPLRSR